MSREILVKIKSLKIEGFRGMLSSEVLDTDGDIVLITGPNGFGKTCLLQAITFLLTGNDKFAGVDNIFNLGSERISIKAEGEFNSGRRETLSVIYKLSVEQPEFSPDYWPKTIRVPGLTEQRGRDEIRGLLARITTFFQEQVPLLFDQVRSGTSLRDIFEPRPTEVKNALKELENQKDHFEHGLTIVDGLRQALETLDERRAKAQREMADAWSPILEVIKILTPHVQVERGILDSLGLLKRPTSNDLSGAVRLLRVGRSPVPGEVGRAVMEELQQLVNREIANARTRAKEVDAPEDLRRLRDEIERKLKSIEDKYPRLDEFVACFLPSPEDVGRLPDLLSVLQTLAKNTDRWIKEASRLPEPERRRLQSVLTELHAVVSTNARVRGQELADWIDEFEEIKKNRDLLRIERNDLNRQLEDYRLSEDVKRLEEAARILRNHSHLFEDAYRQQLRCELLAERRDRVEDLNTRLSKALDEIAAARNSLEQATSPTKQLLEATAEILNLVLSRFNFVDGILPMKVEDIPLSPDRMARVEGEPHTEIKTKSGLSLEDLSTGQRSQTAVALAVAQSQLIREYLPYHILLLDDVSTAYDLSNLTREAVLWRQLAYNEDTTQRWQLFISSHHEDLTNHLLDLLIPPHGSSMRLFRFTDWSPDKGPTIERFSVEPSEDVSSGSQLRKAVREDLKEVLCQSL